MRARTPPTPYRHSFRLLLAYAEAQTGKRPSDMDLADLDAVLVSGFLDHLEDDRGKGVTSRNTRLAAVLHSFFRFASYRHPEHAEAIRQVLAILPSRRLRNPSVPAPTRDDCRYLAQQPLWCRSASWPSPLRPPATLGIGHEGTPSGAGKE
jgi:hypothetical protein